ncbi:MAG: hypothetical protein JST09_19360, partial [Bacteroidetes bacterium]|nr:hypothetical protein [Bacteroidota bacterium]
GPGWVFSSNTYWTSCSSSATGANPQQHNDPSEQQYRCYDYEWDEYEKFLSFTSAVHFVWS